MTYIIFGYSLLNMFMAGYYFANTYRWKDTRKEMLTCFAWTIGTAIFFLPYVIGCALFALIQMPFSWLNKNFQLYFWVTYKLTKKWHNIPEEHLYTINRIAIKKSDNKMKDRIFKRCVRITNKMNNYTYEEKDMTF